MPASARRRAPPTPLRLHSMSLPMPRRNAPKYVLPVNPTTDRVYLDDRKALREDERHCKGRKLPSLTHLDLTPRLGDQESRTGQSADHCVSEDDKISSAGSPNASIKSASSGDSTRQSWKSLFRLST
ncbi:uncharacterized protein L969DRAFT_93372 [Mixia osmundae IAM 14324]|uniref:Uncharacterized protein n=1 Tax=Mixia osmundae (strain CBS 9802 / IAM 14324 / JCM 22182 / KY 12970) TaxID=764103 RepID=G7E598_MIXOS|nr:uncharacterized protein L969DRAFT_93372 [Mixia osmundae IAM 14324]KEI40843.1 hypothetical protein L969DRAFT_93372 [Mixia osmundae IAM 14324]GAA98008.1 hypothetical protein E5Q_04688 [Mixia osmundae IAM 14324]